PGRAAENCASMAKRRRQDSFRMAALAMNWSNGMGWYLVHSPPGERKSGMPHSGEMPAPVKGKMTSAAFTRSRRRTIPVSISAVIMYFPPVARFQVLVLSLVLDPARRQGFKMRHPNRKVRHEISSYHVAGSRSRRRAPILLHAAWTRRDPS